MVPAETRPALAAQDARYENFGVAEVFLSTSLNPRWTGVTGKTFGAALRRTLVDRNLLATDETLAKYQIESQILKVDRPPAAANPTVTFVIHYLVKDRVTGQTIFDQTISQTGTAKWEESKFASVRMGNAIEAAMRDNLGQFMDKLMATPGPAPAKAAKPKLKPH